MLAIVAASVQSKWVGESEKYIKASFTLAVKLSPCVLFIDERDSLFYRRSSDDQSWQRNAVTQFLQQVDGLPKAKESPFVIVATNRPYDLDEAFLRRLPQKVYFRLPDEVSRFKILNLLLKPGDLDPEVNIEEKARMTEGYSGSDLRNVCGEAGMVWMIEQVKRTPNAETMETLKPLKLDVSHLNKALNKIRPSVSKHALRDLADFARRFNPDSSVVCI
jgi:SpoVK/Ycf46/Vps4 family AAA+-type ATPase